MAKNIVIIGGGFGGLETALSLKGMTGGDWAITLVDRNECHFFIPSIHEIVSGKITAASISIPFRTILPPAGIRFVHDEVKEIDHEIRRVATATAVLEYDYLVVAAGAENNFFGVPGVEEHAFRFRRPGDALRIHEELVRLLSGERLDVHLVLAGGGTEGVEVAGELLDLIRDKGREDDLARGRITVTLIEAQQQLLPGFPDGARTVAEKTLRSQGVTIAAGRRITAVNDRSVALDSGAELPRSLLIWTGGIRPSRVISGMTLPKDPAGWLMVNDRLHSPSDERVFAMGDIVTIGGAGGLLPLQRLASHARDQAVTAAINISNSLQNRKLIVYVPRYKPRLVSIGRGLGISVQGNTFRSGKWVVSLKKAVERTYLMSCLTRPFFSGLSRNIPRTDLLKRLALKLPW